MTTLSIIPTTVQRAVSHHFKPNATPVMGPATNFTILASTTEMYFAQGILGWI